MKLIVGLGNPGKEYEKSRHNVGFIILDSYFNGEKWYTKDNYEFLEKNINNEKVIFIKPLTFMNLSGLAVQRVVNFYKIPTEDIFPFSAILFPFLSKISPLDACIVLIRTLSVSLNCGNIWLDVHIILYSFPSFFIFVIFSKVKLPADVDIVSS